MPGTHTVRPPAIVVPSALVHLTNVLPSDEVRAAVIFTDWTEVAPSSVVAVLPFKVFVPEFWRLPVHTAFWLYFSKSTVVLAPVGRFALASTFPSVKYVVATPDCAPVAVTL